MRRYLVNPCAAGVALAIATTAFAPTALSQSETAMLEEVVVTARKREESLAETPLAITALSAEEIKASNFKNIADVQKTAPGLFIESMNNENARTVLMPRFRGVTYDATSPLQRTSSVFVDGLIVSSGLHSLPITQVERIEIIKGPQSALFGRNTYSGAINIVTARPGDEFKGSVEIDYASKSKGAANGYFEGPITDSIGARLTWSYSDKQGHYNNSYVEGQRLGDEKSSAFGVMFDINPSENLNIMIRASQYEDDDGPGAYAVVGGLAEHNFCAEPTPAINSFTCFFVNGLESVYRGSVRVPDTLGASTSSTIFGYATDQLRGPDGRWAGAGGGDGYAPIGAHSFDDLSHNGFGKFGTGDRLGIIMSYDISDSLNLDVRYGSNKDDYVLFHDFDASPTWGFHTYNARVTEDDSFEMRLSGETDRFDWSVGYTQVEMSSKAHGGFYDQYFGDLFGIGAGYWFPDINNPRTAFGMIEADTTGIYGSIDYRITDDLTLIAEVRRQEDEVNDPNVNAAAGKNISPGTFESTLPRIVLKYDMSDNIMTYLNYSEGTLPGGFNPEVASKLTTAEQISTFNNDTPGITETFGEETLKNYELGWKMTSEDGSMTANVAIFHMERSDQIYSGFGVIPSDISCSGDDDGDGVPNTETCTVAFSGNGTSSKIDGVEFDMAWAATPNLTIQSGFAYTKARISDFPESGDCGDYNDVFGAGASCEGQVAARYPKWTGSLVATHTQNTSMGEMYMRGEIYHTGNYYDEVTNLTEIPSATEINLRAGLRMDNLSLEAYVSNLTDENAPTGGNNISDTSAYVRNNTFAYNFAVESVHIHLRDKREFGLRATYNF